MYPPEFTEPMRKELKEIGVDELRTPAEVDAFMAKEGTKLLVVNSICGCAAGAARPAVRLALKSPVKPEHVASVFAGVDTEATAKARSHFPEIPPSSPSMYLFKGREVVYFLPRHMIEMRRAGEIAGELIGAFKEHCEAPAKA